MLLYNDCPHLSKDAKFEKYTGCKNLLTYIHPKTPKLFRSTASLHIPKDTRFQKFGVQL